MGATQLVGGIMADRLAVRWLLVAAMTLLTATCVVLAWAETLPMLVSGYVLFGCSAGMMSIVAGTAWARYFGRTHLGKIRGTSLTAAVAARRLGPGSDGRQLPIIWTASRRRSGCSPQW